MRKRSQRVVVGLMVGVGVTLCKPAMALAGTITTPSTNPFAVQKVNGQLQPFTIVATGFEPGSQVYATQCDGTNPDTPGWSPAANCDIGTANTAVIADATGKATFTASDANHRFQPFKGESPQGLFNCLASGQAPPANGLPSYTNCKVRVSSSLVFTSADQAFLGMTLPK